MGRRKGYEYAHRFEVVRRDQIQLTYVPHIAPGIQSVVFEVRTRFMVKTAGRPDEVVGSEVFSSCMLEQSRLMSIMGFDNLMGDRISHYGMTEGEINELAREALDLIFELDAGSRGLGIVVNLDVCSVQLEGEEYADVRERAITEHNLCELSICRPLETPDDVDLVVLGTMIFISELKWRRVYNVKKALRMMPCCGCCGEVPKLGAQIVKLPACRCAFHFHCITGFLLKRETDYCCPVCHVKMDDFLGGP